MHQWLRTVSAALLLLSTLSPAVASVHEHPALPPTTDDYGPLHEPELSQSFSVYPDAYLMGIAWDGNHYWCLEGGLGDGWLRRLSADGTELDAIPLQVDGRGIVFNPLDQHLYLSSADGDLVRIDDPTTGAHTVLQAGVMQSGDGSLGMPVSGERLLDMQNGACQIQPFYNGGLVYTLDGLECGATVASGATAIAADDGYFYTWDSDGPTLYVHYDNGGLAASYPLSNGDRGITLSHTNHRIWVAEQAQAGEEGIWYGYSLREWIADPVSLTLSPTAAVVPPVGGDVVYTTTLASSLNLLVPGLTFWTLVETPGGTQVGPTLSVGFTHTPGMNVSVPNMTQTVPGFAPPGYYLLRGYVGMFPTPSLTSAFTFVKLPGAGDGQTSVGFDRWPAGQPGSTVTRIGVEVNVGE